MGEEGFEPVRALE